MHYKVIFLIISSNDLELYNKMKNISNLYFNLFVDTVKYFYVEYKNLENQTIIENNEYIYVDGVENHTPGMYNKTIKAMEYINNKYDYDFIIRTNVSSFWNIYNVLNLLNTLPLSNFAGGFAVQGFITGTGIILSKDVCNILVNNYNANNIINNNRENLLLFNEQLNSIKSNLNNLLSSINDLNLPNNCSIKEFNNDLSLIMQKYNNNTNIFALDNLSILEDVLISNIIRKYNIQILNIINYKWGFLINDMSPLPSNCEYVSVSLNFNPNISFSENVLYFRIKNTDRDIDLQYFKLLLKKIYNITETSVSEFSKSFIVN